VENGGKKMKKKNSIVLLCIITLLSTMIIHYVYAVPPEPASGTWTYVNTKKEITKKADGNVFIYGEEEGTWTGTFEGTSFDYFEIVKHSNGFVNCQGRISFEGTVKGEDGTLEILFVGKKDIAANHWMGKWVILSGTEGLKNLKGQGNWEGPSADLDYSGMIHFSP
jgi:hypothetical protein